MISIEDITKKWEEILNYIKVEFTLSDISFHTWFEPLSPVLIRGSDLYILAEDDVCCKYVQKYEKFFIVAINEITGEQLIPHFVTDEDIPEESVKSSSGPSIEILKKADINPKYTFETFVSGKSNELAHAASLAVAENPGKEYKLLYLYGGTGLGKTHLMNAIGYHILKDNPDANVIYVTTERFTSDFIEHLRSNDATSFRKKYRSCDVLLIDDIQFIAKKEGTQEEFFNTFNDLYQHNKQIIISSDKPPKEIENLVERLKSRFEGSGLLVDIQPPNYETRMAILRKKEELENYHIDNEVIKYIASNIKTNIRELEGALTRIVARSKLEKIPINIDMAIDTLKDFIGNEEIQKKITTRKIISVVAEHFGIKPDDIISKKKNKEIAYPRQIVMYLSRELTDDSLIQIGKAVGGKDHSTIIYGHDKISKDITKDNELNHIIETIRKKLGE